MASTVAQGADIGSVSVKDLERCYEAFTRRRRLRGERSIRTPEGFQRLQKRYQLHVRTTKAVGGDCGAVSDSTRIKDDDVDDTAGLRNVLNVYFNPKILRLITVTCWRLAHFGGDTSDDERDCAGLELDAEKYSNFTFRLIQWVLPELPRREVKELTQYDWELDRKFDEHGRDGLSLQGFKLSLLDLACSCTDGTVNKCLEFLNLMARWLQHSLPPYARDVTPQVIRDFVRSTTGLKPPPPKRILPTIVWDTIPLSMMTPCQIGLQGLYCELKAKASPAPMVIMVLSADEKPIELVLATSSKLLLSKTETHKDIYRKVSLSNALCGQLKRQGCWTFCMSPKMPSILLVPGSIVSRQTKKLYACFRMFDSEKPSLDSEGVEHDCDNKTPRPNEETNEAIHTVQNVALSLPVSSLMTLFTSIPDQISLGFNSKNNTCHRMERMSSRIFTLERRSQLGEAFAITLTASLLQSTNAAGGPGAAATMSSTFETKSVFTVSDSYLADPKDGDARHLEAHTFVFILRNAGSTASKKNGLRQEEAMLPQQWFTPLDAANETKTIIFESPAESPSAGNPAGPSENDTAGSNQTQHMEIYQLFIFTLHGVYIEIVCNAEIPGLQNEASDKEIQDAKESDVDDSNVFSVGSEMTSARLLQELLLLQKTRQLEKTSELPPDMVIGTQMSTTKPVTTAEALRSKVLRSRQDERHARFQMLEVAIRNKLRDSKAARTFAPIISEELNHSDENVEDPPSPTPELEKRVYLLTTFFHEMAVHQPRRDELHGGAAEMAEASAQEQLLQRFGDLFDCDVELQNAVDEEKWSTDTAKGVRRRDSLSTNLPKFKPVTATRDQTEDGKCPWTFEDYENTAQYIEQLMLNVATHETQQRERQDIVGDERKREVMAQLIASWQYTQHRIDKAAMRKRVEEIEQKGRNDWMRSQHVQKYGAAVSARRGEKPERPGFILPKQRFLVQEHSLPSNTIWEIPRSPSNQIALLSSGPMAAAGLVSPTRPTSLHGEIKSPAKLKPQRPLQRPATMSAVERPSNVTALHAASIARARVRRIRSANSTTRDESTPSRIQARRITLVLSPTHLDQKEVPSRQEEPIVSDLPVSPLAISTEGRVGAKEGDNSILNSSNDFPQVTDDLAPVEVAPVSSSARNPPTKLDSSVVADTKGLSMERRPVTVVTRKRRWKKKKRSRDVHFRRRVLALVAISAQLQAVADEEWKEAQGVGSVDQEVTHPANKIAKLGHVYPSNAAAYHRPVALRVGQRLGEFSANSLNIPI